MSDIRVDSIIDDDGDMIEVSHMGPLVVLRSVERESGHVQEVFLDADRRDRFAKAWAEAERQAEAAEAAEANEAAPFFRAPGVHDDRRRAAHEGRNGVERLARDLIGIPDNL